jgi:hypothetical protein
VGNVSAERILLSIAMVGECRKFTTPGGTEEAAPPGLAKPGDMTWFRSGWLTPAILKAKPFLIFAAKVNERWCIASDNSAHQGPDWLWLKFIALRAKGG